MNWSLEAIAGALVLILGAIGGGSMLRRRVSKDSAGVAVDKAEGSYIESALVNMTLSRDKWQAAALDFSDQLSKCREERRGFEVRDDYMRQQVIDLHLALRTSKEQIESAHRKLLRVHPELAKIFTSDFGVADLEPRPSVPIVPINLSEGKS